MFGLMEKLALLEDVQLQPHQQRVADKARKQLRETGKSRLLLVHGLGSGKTLSSIAAAEQAGVPYTAAVPAALRENYRKDLARFSPDSPAAVISHEALAKGGVPNPQSLVIDELQRLRNPESQKGQALLDRADRLKSLVLLTGTPIVNDPTELSTYISALTGRKMTPQEFDQQYVRRTTERPGLIGRILGAEDRLPGVRNEDELVSLLRGKVDFHEAAQSPATVRKEDVSVDMTPDQSDLYLGMYKRLPALTRWKLERQHELRPKELLRLRSFMTGPRQVGLSEYGVSKDRRLTPLAAFDRSPKLQEAVKRLTATLAANREAKALVFSNFIDAGLRPYQAALERSGVPSAIFSGSLNDRQRRQILEDYNSGKTRALLVGPSGTEGLSTRGTRLVQLLDPHWNDARSRQSVGRALRYDSHLHLPPEDRDVLIERYFARPLSRGFAGLFRRRAMPGADDYLTQLAESKERLNSPFMQVLRRAAGDDATRIKSGGAPSTERLDARLGLLGGGLAALATVAYLNYKLNNALKEMRGIPRGAYSERLIENSGLKGIPVLRQSGLNNAYWQEPDDYPSEDFPGNKKEQQAKADAAARLGVVVLDPKFRRPGILAHELGHGSIHQSGGLSRFNQSWLRPLGASLNSLLAPGIGAVVGVATQNPIYGLTAGTLAGGLTGLPVLINERQATNRGKSFMDKTPGLSPEEDKKNRKGLETAYSTYLANALVPGIAAGAVGGGISALRRGFRW